MCDEGFLDVGPVVGRLGRVKFGKALVLGPLREEQVQLAEIFHHVRQTPHLESETYLTRGCGKKGGHAKKFQKWYRGQNFILHSTDRCTL